MHPMFPKSPMTLTYPKFHTNRSLSLSLPNVDHPDARRGATATPVSAHNESSYTGAPQIRKNVWLLFGGDNGQSMLIAPPL